jgi:hypothetical protein
MQNKQKTNQVITPLSNKIDKLDKVSMRVVIHTQGSVIIGDVYVRPRNRLIDELIGSDAFIAVTDAEVYEKPNNARVRTKFLALNREHIIMAMPWDEMERKT